MSALSESSPAARDGSLDTLKGFLIVLVVIGHSGIGAALPHAADSFPPSLLLRGISILPPIYYFHIALFFTVSVVLMKADSLIKVARRLFLLSLMYCFWMCWPVIWYLVKAYIDHPRTEFLPFWNGNVSPWLMTQLSGFAWGTWQRTGILWFVPALVVFSLLTAIALRLLEGGQTAIGRRVTLTLLGAGWIYYVSQANQVALAHVAGKIPWSADVAAYLLPLGLLHRWVYRQRGLFEKLSVAVLAAGVVVGEVLITVFEPTKVHSPYHYRIDFAQFSVASTILGLVGFTLLTTSLLLMALRAKGTGLMAVIGRYSLPVFVMHMYFIETDWVAISTFGDRLATVVNSGTLESLRYAGRMATAIFLPIGISVVVGSLVPFARPLGFIAPASVLAWRRSFVQWVTSRLRRSPSMQS